MKLHQDIRLPVGLEPAWSADFLAELKAADSGLPRLSAAALELAALAGTGEYDAKVVGQILERDDKLRAQVIQLANSVVYGGETRITETADAAQRIGMRALYEMAVVEVARVKVFGPALGNVLGGSKMWSVARLGGAISHLLSAKKLGRAHASILSGLILNVGPPLAHQMIRRVEEQHGMTIPSRVRRELSHRVAPSLSVALVEAWSLSKAISIAARALADGRCELPDEIEAQIAVFSVSLARYLKAGGTRSLSIPMRWPAAIALGLTMHELKEIVEAADSVDDFSLVG